ncbi:MAG: hypothetical protein ABJN14_02065 [Paracoccaceae bacterium]
MKREPVKKQTRGTKNARALKGGGGQGRNIGGLLDLEAVQAIGEDFDELLPAELLEEIKEICVRYDFHESVNMHLVRSRSPFENKLKSLENTAAKLRDLLKYFAEDQVGREHVKVWLRDYELTVRDSITDYTPPTEIGLVQLLDDLSKVMDTKYHNVPVAGHWRSLISDLYASFAAHGVLPTKSEDGVFVVVLKELNRQFPGLVFPGETQDHIDDVEGRGRYVRLALSESSQLKGS